MKAVDVARNFAESASGLKVLQGVFVSAGFGRVRLTTTDLSLWCQVELESSDAATGHGFGAGAESGNRDEEHAAEPRGTPQRGRRRGVPGGFFGSASCPAWTPRNTPMSKSRRGACAVDAVDGRPG